MAVQMIPPALRPSDEGFPPQHVYYPDSDGEPMAETQAHIRCIIYLRTALDTYFRDRPDVYISGNMFLYYQEGDPREVIAPDVFVVIGGDPRVRRVYKLWEEQPPTVVFEITSRGAEMRDVGAKFGLYEAMGAREYILFDPLGEYLKPRLQGLRRGAAGDFVRLPLNADGSLWSEELGLELRVLGEELRLVDRARGEMIPDAVEQARAREIEAAGRQAAEAKLADAEGRLAEADAEIARLRVELERRAANGG